MSIVNFICKVCHLQLFFVFRPEYLYCFLFILGTIVQQEASIQNIKENKHCTEKTVVHEVNLETFPDNLERPPDYEELKKQSSFYASHQKHLRTELNSSPSSLLCDNPDIPCVTLAPAAPPIHSSAKSDKSESSSDSKREMASFTNAKNVKKEVNIFTFFLCHEIDLFCVINKRHNLKDLYYIFVNLIHLKIQSVKNHSQNAP